MRKIKKSYVEKDYKFGGKTVTEISNRNPLDVEKEERLYRFRFYDQEFIIDNEKIYEGPKENFSVWIYFGKRTSLNEVLAKYGPGLECSILLSKMASKHLKETSTHNYVCLTDDGYLEPMEDDSIAFNEIVTTQEKKRNILTRKRSN